MANPQDSEACRRAVWLLELLTGEMAVDDEIPELWQVVVTQANGLSYGTLSWPEFCLGWFGTAESPIYEAVLRDNGEIHYILNSGATLASFILKRDTQGREYVADLKDTHFYHAAQWRRMLESWD